MSSIARVAKLKRLRARVREMQGAWRVQTPVDPGPLLDLMVRISPHLQPSVHMEAIAEQVERCLDEDIEMCFSMPPRHGKTTLLIHAIVWILLTEPTASILYVSYAHGFAATQVRAAMALAQAAGIQLGDIQRAGEWTTAAGGRVKAAGVGGQLAGEGFRVIFVDDPHKNRAEAESPLIRGKVFRGFLDDIYTRQDPKGTSVFVVHTRWHEDDLIGNLTTAKSDAVGYAKPFAYTNIRAIEVDSDGEEVALAPWLFSIDRLRKLRETSGPYGWESLYQGEPKPRSGRLFVDAQVIESLDAPEHDGYRYAIGLDLARTRRTRADWHAAVVMRRSMRTGAIDVVEVEHVRCALVDHVVGRRVVEEGFVRRLHALQQRYPEAQTYMYTGRDEEALLALLAGQADYPCEVIATPAPADKWVRAQPYGAAWRKGTVRVPRHQRWTNGFVTEHVRFTGADGDKDDQVDAAAAAYDALANDGDNAFDEVMRNMRYAA